MAGADQCGVADRGGALGVKLAGVEDGEDLDRPGDAVDQEVVGMDHRLAGSGQPSGAVNIGVIGQVLRRVHDRGVQPLCGREIPRADIVENVQKSLVASSVQTSGSVNAACVCRRSPAPLPLPQRVECWVCPKPSHARPWRGTTHHTRLRPRWSRTPTRWGLGGPRRHHSGIYLTVKSVRESKNSAVGLT